MSVASETPCIAFGGPRRIARGPLHEVAVAVKEWCDRGEPDPILVFDASTSRPIELDLRGSVDEVSERYRATPPIAARRRGPGRPKLGVVSREVTLLPRHWEWLAAQRGGASATLRRLVDRARRRESGTERIRLAQEAAYRFLAAIAGDEAGFEESLRALYRLDRAGFERASEPWPDDVRAHGRALADAAFEAAFEAAAGHVPDEASGARP